MSDRLKNKQIRVTEFRLKVLEIFERSNVAVDINHIESKLGSYDRVTLYRTLKTFIDKGLIHEISIPNENKQLALCATECSADGHKHEHIHFKCKSCEGIFCKEIIEMPPISINGFSIDKVEISASGICENCL